MRDLLSLEQYRGELLDLVWPDPRQERVTLSDAVGRVLAVEVSSPVSIPGFDNSAMDGYAVRFADVITVPCRLRMVADVPAGSPADPPASPGECVRIMTGAALPGFADTVVPVEDTRADSGFVVVDRAPPGVGCHVRRSGSDIAAGTRLARPGTEITPGLAGALAASGLTGVAVRPRPVVAVCATGDELVQDGAPLRRGQIYESNSVAVAGLLSRAGARVSDRGVVSDRPDDLAQWLDHVRECDLVVLTGGASVGAYDVVRDVLSERAGGVFRHVRVQPGKPQGWGVWPDGPPVVALPGNPVSALLSAEVFVRPLLDRLLGREDRCWFTAVALTGWRSPAGRRQLVPVRLTTSAEGLLTAEPAHSGGSGSHLVTSMSAADGYVMVAEDVTVVEPGDRLAARWL